MKEVLVTGANGQLGSNLMSRCKNNFVGLDLKGPVSIQCDLLDQSQLKNLKPKLKNITTLIHLASIVQDSSDLNDLKSTIDLNILSTINILNVLPRLKYIIFSSSMMVYGVPQKTPISETHPTDPTNLYGVSKLFLEYLLKIYKSQNPKLKICIMRFSSIYGPGKYSGDQNRAIPNFIRLAKKNHSPVIFGSVNEKRDYLFIDDAISAIINVLKYRPNAIINIGSGNSITIKKFADLICSLIGASNRPVVKNLNSIEDDYLLDNSLAKELINFDPKTNIENGLIKEIENV